MKSFSEKANLIFNKATADYHLTDSVDTPIINPFEEGTIDSFLYQKNWIDVVQWHLEDIIRDPNIDPVEALKIKRTIDKSNQVRTDLVEQIDSYFLYLYKDVEPKETATINTESPAWALDRLSILVVKIYQVKIRCKVMFLLQIHLEQFGPFFFLEKTQVLDIFRHQNQNRSCHQ